MPDTASVDPLEFRDGADLEPELFSPLQAISDLRRRNLIALAVFLQDDLLITANPLVAFP
jgi:hypothetical protein